MAIVVDLDDVVMHNAFTVYLVKRGQDEYARDRFLRGQRVGQNIRAYFYPTGSKTRTFIEGGEITDNIITMFVSKKWLDANSVEVGIKDLIVYQSSFYRILTYQDVADFTSIREYTMQKEVGMIDNDPLP